MPRNSRAAATRPHAIPAPQFTNLLHPPRPLHTRTRHRVRNIIASAGAYVGSASSTTHPPMFLPDTSTSQRAAQARMALHLPRERQCVSRCSANDTATVRRTPASTILVT